MATLVYWDQGAFKGAMEAAVDRDDDLDIQVTLCRILQPTGTLSGVSQAEHLHSRNQGVFKGHLVRSVGRWEP